MAKEVMFYTACFIIAAFLSFCFCREAYWFFLVGFLIGVVGAHTRND